MSDADNLATINKIIEEHYVIRGHIKLVGDRLADREALLSLENARDSLIPGRAKDLSEEQSKLQQALSLVDEGLKNHFAFEEGVLPSLLGGILMRGFMLEHRIIQNEIQKVKAAVTEANLEVLSPGELVSQESQLREVVSGVCRVVEGHATKEEAILEMMRRALEQEKTDEVKREAILKELALLEEMRRLHEWTVFGQKEAEEEEKTETELDSKASV